MTMSLQDALQRTIEHREIFHDEMLALMRRIMSGEMSPVMQAALLMGLRVKKETIGEITAAAQVMREFSTKVEVADRSHLVDIVGTGGDGSHTFNISTATMFVVAGAGGQIGQSGADSRAGCLVVEQLDDLVRRIAAARWVSQEGAQVARVVEHCLRQRGDLRVVGDTDEQGMAAGKVSCCRRQQDFAALDGDEVVDLDGRDAQDAGQ